MVDELNDAREHELIGRLSEKRNSIFVNRDSGIIYLQNSLKKFKLDSWRKHRISQDEYENPNSVYIKFVYRDKIYSGIIETKDNVDSRAILFNAPNIISDVGGNVINIIMLPFERIPLYPFFDIIKMILNEEINKLKASYLSNIYDNNYEDVIKKWYEDYINYRREITYKFIPEVEYVSPHWLTNLKLFILIFEEGKGIATRYYYTEQKDDVIVKRIIKNSDDIHELFMKNFQLPNSKYLLTEGSYFSYVTDYINRANHPFFEAVKDIQKQINNFNKAQPIKYYNAYILTKSMINNWSIKKINMIRQITNILPELKNYFKNWLKKINVLNLYYINEPEKGRITDGLITTYYISNGEDKTITIQVKNKEDVKFNEDIIIKYFPEATGDVFYGSSSLILSYLEEKIGARY